MTSLSAMKGSLEVGIVDLVQGIFTGANEDVEVIKDLRFRALLLHCSLGRLLLFLVFFSSCNEKSTCRCWGNRYIFRSKFYDTCYYYVIPQFFLDTSIRLLGGAFACYLVYAFSWKSGLSPLRIILVGIAINAMFTGLNESFITICGYFIKSIKQTTTSNITMKTWSDVEIMVTYGTIGLILALFVGAWCNLLSLQDKTAKT